MMNNALTLLASLKSNPMQFLSSLGVSLPQNMNDPQAIIQHLLNTGKISQQQLNNVMNMKNDPRVKQIFGI